MPIPSFFKGCCKDYTEDDYAKFYLQGKDGEDVFEVWYYGDIFIYETTGTHYIVNTETAPAKIVAKSVSGNEEIVVYDGCKFGYDNMFCDTYTKGQIENRPLQKLQMPAAKLLVTLGYSIDYEGEKEDYDFGENGEVILADNSAIPWETVLTDGFDYFNLTAVFKDGSTKELADFELA